MTRVEFATSLIARAAAWVRQDLVQQPGKNARPLSFDHVEILLSMGRYGGSARFRELRTPGEATIDRVKPDMAILVKRGYATLDTTTSATLTDKGRLFVNTILK